MGIWNLYFILKLLLLWAGIIGFHMLPNFIFAVLLTIRLRPRWARIARQVIAIPAGAALLYYDSNLPPFARFIEQLPALLQFRFSYIIELLGRFVSARDWLLLAIMVLVYWIVNRWVRVTTFVLLALLIVPGVLRVGTLVSVSPVVAAQGDTSAVTAGAGAGATGAAGGGATAGAAGEFVAGDGEVPPGANPNAALNSFYARELTRSVSLPAQAGAGPDFDIIFLHICSLAQDDLDVDNLNNQPLLSRFDFVFKNFNSAASYSGPAAIRVLRAGCGQPTHKALYDPAGPQCYVMSDLKQLGFTPTLALNHDGHFDNFMQEVQQNFNVQGITPFDNTHARVAMRAFDETPIRSDGDVLQSWWKQRTAQPDKRVALYYNTISLHDGNRLEGSKLSSAQSYPLRAKAMFDDFSQFIDTIAKSGRKAVVVFVPEHGAALRGSKLQISGMREIPLPEITHVPVAVKLVGFGNDATAAHGTPITISTPTSYLALMTLVSHLVANNPFAGTPDLAQYANDLPQTAFVSANEQTTVMRYDGKMLIRGADGVWLDLKSLE
ncbi:cellulose biosynthesis protein BcsG [Pandoraea fibrosis]|uniref:Cellulose biosynthesis protein BcsG n=1 Tax=Pandoraea fibrosis TaxID=1891094 RepID=A0ABX6HT56_9BURK|nr:cellulose biosynthesis protein BcsG [Pandoraea fibrosis]QHE92701.1 cellulose biosynthesis protein BcsG [Pandoraea fibrosis]QHF13742.1 cellulose biosynthesis protein BcsG [Pandoraea fibrosis]